MKYFYFYDCPRTGGTSFKSWCKGNPHIKRVCYKDSKSDWFHVPFNPREEIERLVPGENDLVTFTILRDPIEHTISLYDKISRHKNHAYRSKLAGVSFSEWVHGVFEVDRQSSPDPWGFSFVHFYDPKTRDVNVAIKNIESMDFVGFTDKLLDDLNSMLVQHQSAARFDNRRSNAGRRGFKVSKEDKLKIKLIRADDYALVNHFRKKRGLPTYG